jgi:hypothetical protein
MRLHANFKSSSEVLNFYGISVSSVFYAIGFQPKSQSKPDSMKSVSISTTAAPIDLALFDTCQIFSEPVSGVDLRLASHANSALVNLLSGAETTTARAEASLDRCSADNDATLARIAEKRRQHAICMYGVAAPDSCDA